ncbi:autotransporter outer membrane beta-barrel domain-containing protein [Siccibacter turicensis]|uniref:autotransporter family protein n=1 Tax=Siccibacter turicensis TaxID=357233 RepID=UPI000464C8B5|nr:autotransporter outer membrane beta-barrel domain-containing protein [Siccibacter turicensis]
MKKSRISQHGALLVALTSAHGALLPSAWAAADTLIIDEPETPGFQVPMPFDSIRITNTGSLVSQGQFMPALTISPNVEVLELDNEGAIYGRDSFAVYNEGNVSNLKNSGTIISDGAFNGRGDALFNSQTGKIDNLVNSGTITSTSVDNASYVAINNQGTIGTLYNTPTGNISGFVGINNFGRIDYLKNAGSITNLTATNFDTNPAIVNNGSIGTLENIGTIASNINTVGAIRSMPAVLNFGTIDTLVNNGLIVSDERAIENQGTLETIVNTGTIKGDIVLYGPSLTATFIGADIGEGILTGAAGTGAIHARGDVIFRSGSMLLNDNIYSRGTVYNKAATLKLIDAITINGNYYQGSDATLVSGVSDKAIANGEIGADAGYGRLNVNGSTIVEPGSRIVMARGGKRYDLAPGQRYVVINTVAGPAQYNADTLKYEVEGYTAGVKGYTVTDNNQTALVVTLGKDGTPIETPHPVDPTVPVEPTKPGTPTTPVTPTAPGKPSLPSTPAPQPQPPEVVRPGATLPNATRALGGLANYSGISPQLLELYNASLAINDSNEANRVGERLSPGQSISTSTATGMSTTAASGVVRNHMDAQRNPQIGGASGVATGDAYEDWILWGQPFGGFANQDSTKDVSGYRAKFGGLIIGADRALGDLWRVGAAVNYSNTSVHGKDNLNGNNSTADNYGVIGYASFSGEPWYVNLSAGVNRQNYQANRQVDFTGFEGRAQSKYNGQSVTLQSEFGYPLTLPADIVLTPLAGLSYSYQHVDGYSENGGNGMALNVGSSHTQSVTSDIGARLSHTFDTSLGDLTPFAQLSWIHQYDNRQVSSSASYAADTVGETRFITKGIAPVEDMAGVAVGSTLYDVNGLSVDARYDLQAAEHYQAHAFNLRLQKTF